jgi:hypothetical protein
VPSPDDPPATDHTDDTDDTGAVTDGAEDPTERADDGMAPFIANTGDDDSPDGDADAASG